jgi:hypothetical protein
MKNASVEVGEVRFRMKLIGANYKVLVLQMLIFAPIVVVVVVVVVDKPLKFKILFCFSVRH